MLPVGQGSDWMFLKVKRAAGKQYFAICVSERRDKKVVTKTICSLGDAAKALPTLQTDYPQFLDRFHAIVGTNKCRDKYYGLCAADGEFLRVEYSGLNFKLPYTFKDYWDAEKFLSTLTIKDLYVVKELPGQMALDYESEIKRRWGS